MTGGAAVGPRASWPFLLVTLALLGVGLSFWRPVPAGVWNDDGVYMLVGKALGGGEGLRYAGVPGDPPAVRYPPLYVVVLGGMWALLGSVGSVTLAAVLLNLVLVGVAGGLTAWALHRSGAMPRWGAVAAAGLAFASADVWRTALLPLSEPLFLALCAGALAAWPAAVRGPGLRSLGPLAALLAAAVLTRSAGVALVAGFGVALTLRYGLRVAAAATAPALAAAAGWAVWASERAGQVPPHLDTVLGPYSGWFAGQLLASPGAFLAALPAHLEAVVARVLALLVPGLTGPLLWVAGIPLAAAAALGARSLGRTLTPLPWAAAAYLGMLVVWPFVDRRLVAPLHPWVVAAVVAGILEGARRVRTGPWAGAPALLRVGAALVLAWALAYAAVTASRAAREWAVAPYQLRAGRLAAAVEALRSTAPPGAVVGAPEFWAALHLHGGWEVSPSARFEPRGDEGTPVWGAPEEQLAIWRASGVDHLLLEQGGQIHGKALDLLEARCPGSVTILARMPPQILVRLDAGQPCAADGARPR